MGEKRINSFVSKNEQRESGTRSIVICPFPPIIIIVILTFEERVEVNHLEAVRVFLSVCSLPFLLSLEFSRHSVSKSIEQ